MLQNIPFESLFKICEKCGEKYFRTCFNCFPTEEMILQKKRYEFKCEKCNKDFFTIGGSERRFCDNCGILNEIDNRIHLLYLPRRYENSNFDTYIEKSDNQKKMKECCLEWLENDKGLYLGGGIGCGKTHLAISCIKELALKYDSNCMKFRPVSELLLQIRETFNDKNGEDESDIVEKYSNYTYLVLDDFGNQKVSEFVVETLYLIINARYNANKNKIIITSNLELQELSKMFDDRIASRLNEMCKVTYFKLPDYRQEKKGKW